MKIKEVNNLARFEFDIHDKKISNKFDLTGKIGVICLRVKSRDVGNTLKMKIGKTILTEDDFFAPPDQLPDVIVNHCTEIEFNAGDVFEFEQISDNVCEITLWVFELINQHETITYCETKWT